MPDKLDDPNNYTQRDMNIVISTLIILLTLTSFSIINDAKAQVFLKQEHGRFSIENRSAADILDVSRGIKQIGRLASNETWSNDEIPAKDLLGNDLPLKVEGHIKLEHWGDALNQLPGNSLWAHIQLQTAGLDIERGSNMNSLMGTRRLSKNINLLRQATPEMGEVWLDAGPLNPLKAALLAFASRYVPVSVLLDQLIPQIKPRDFSKKSGYRDEKPVWPEGYEALPDPRSSIREAIELHGTPALSAVLQSEAWSHDRGFRNPELALALIPAFHVLESLRNRENQHDAKVLQARLENEKQEAKTQGLLAAKPYIDDMFQARKDGNVTLAIEKAIATSLIWHLNGLSPQPSMLSKTLCSYLDIGAQRSVNEKQLLAAQAYLNLGQYVCFGHPYYRSRVAEFFRTRGDLSFFDLDIEAALHWYRAAVLMSSEVLDKVRLIDTLARLAIFEISVGDSRLASAYLTEARDQETPEVPIRKLLVLANDLMPIPDQRARLGMIFMIVILGVVALSQILKVLFDRKKK